MNEKVTFIVPPTTGERKLLQDSVDMVLQRSRGMPVHQDAEEQVFRRLQEARGETPRG